MKAVVFINLDANGGRAAKRWENIVPELTTFFSQDSRYIPFNTHADLTTHIKSALNDGFNIFVSAGGDGSAHYLINHLMQVTDANTRHLWLGAIGLGSSNDFIKPKKHFVRDIPTRLNLEKTILADVGKAEWMDTTGKLNLRYFIANASIGVTADANMRFNEGDAFLNFFKKRWTGLSILYTAFRTIMSFRNFQAKLIMENTILESFFSNIAVLKSPFVSGSFCFDDPVLRDDGLLGINICLDMNKMELLATLAGLASGKFRGRSKTISRQEKHFSFISAKPLALEMDGEIVKTGEVRFSVMPKAIYLLGL